MPPTSRGLAHANAQDAIPFSNKERSFEPPGRYTYPHPHALRAAISPDQISTGTPGQISSGANSPSTSRGSAHRRQVTSAGTGIRIRPETAALERQLCYMLLDLSIDKCALSLATTWRLSARQRLRKAEPGSSCLRSADRAVNYLESTDTVIEAAGDLKTTSSIPSQRLPWSRRGQALGCRSSSSRR